MQGVWIADTSGKPVKISDLNQRPADLAYFTFRSIVLAIIVDKRAPDKVLSLEFSLRLPQNFQSAASISIPPGTPATKPPLATKTPPSVNARSIVLDSYTDESLAQLGVAELQVLLLEAHSAIFSPIISTLTTGVAPSNLFPTFNPISASAVTSSSTPKMDRIRSVVSSRESMTYTGPLDFLDSQSQFDLIFGPTPTMLCLAPGKNKQCASEDTEYLATKLLEFCNFCQLNIFCDSVQLQYVGTDLYDS